MLEPENKLFTGWSLGRLQRRSNNASRHCQSWLDRSTDNPNFEEATQTAAYLFDLHLGFLDQNRFWFKSAVGLSQLGLMNQWHKIASCHSISPPSG